MESLIILLCRSLMLLSLSVLFYCRYGLSDTFAFPCETFAFHFETSSSTLPIQLRMMLYQTVLAHELFMNTHCWLLLLTGYSVLLID